MILEKTNDNVWLTASAKPTLWMCILLLLSCSTGCASSGTLQPHHAFRQATTPYQGYYQGQQSPYTSSARFDAGSPNDFTGYSGYNATVPNYNQPNAASGSYGVYENQFPNPYGNLNGGQVPNQGAYQQYYPNAGYNYQPAYSGGFTSGSC